MHDLPALQQDRLLRDGLDPVEGWSPNRAGLRRDEEPSVSGTAKPRP